MISAIQWVEIISASLYTGEIKLTQGRTFGNVFHLPLVTKTLGKPPLIRRFDIHGMNPVGCGWRSLGYTEGPCQQCERLKRKLMREPRYYESNPRGWDKWGNKGETFAGGPWLIREWCGALRICALYVLGGSRIWLEDGRVVDLGLDYFSSRAHPPAACCRLSKWHHQAIQLRNLLFDPPFNFPTMACYVLWSYWLLLLPQYMKLLA